METAPKYDELRPIPGVMDYYASYDGRIWDAKRQRWPKLSHHSVGYLQIGLRQVDGGFRVEKVHRLVAMAWLPNPECKYSVNHRDADKKNNAVANLEWATMKENIGHASRMGLLGNKPGKVRRNLGKRASEQTRAKLSAAKAGVRHPKFSGYYLTPAGRFATQAEAAEANRVSSKTIRTRCQSRQVLGWGFEPASMQSPIDMQLGLAA